MEKATYIAPQIERIMLDNEIALALESNPANGPGEGFNKVPEYLNNDPFKLNVG
jgi:hypothetical protein